MTSARVENRLFTPLHSWGPRVKGTLDEGAAGGTPCAM